MGHRAATIRPIELAVVVTPTNEWVSCIPLAADTTITTLDQGRRAQVSIYGIYTMLQAQYFNILMQHSSLSPEIRSCGRPGIAAVGIAWLQIAKTTFCAGFPHARPEPAAAMHACFLGTRLELPLLKNLLSWHEEPRRPRF